MKTAKGSTHKSLLNVSVITGDLTMTLPVPMSIGDIDHAQIDKIIPWIDDKIESEKKPANTLERCMNQIELHRYHLAKAYVELFECYRYHITTQTRQSPADKAQITMLTAMPDAMLLQFAKLYLSEDRMLDVILPDDREAVIDEVIAQMKTQTTNGVKA